MHSSLFRQIVSRVARLRGADWRLTLVGSLLLWSGLLALVWGLTVHRLDVERALVLRAAQAQQENLAVIVSENLGQVAERGRLLAIAAAAWFDGDRSDTARQLSAMVAGDRAYLRVGLYAPDGRNLFSSAPAGNSDSLAAAIRSPGAAGEGRSDERPRLGPLPTSYEQAWQVSLLFPVSGRDGGAQGVLVVVLDLGYFLGLYQAIDFGRSGVIQILSDDGRGVAEMRREGLALSTGTKHFRQFDGDIGHAGTVTGDLFGDGRDYQSSYRHVGQLPLLVVASRDVAELLGTHPVSRSRYLLAMAVLTAILAAAAVWLASSIRRHGQLLAALTVADGEKRELIGRLEDEKRRAFMLAAHDPLTGLPNRRMFSELSASHLSGARRSRRPHALMYIDLDRFKAINDTLGHHVGDLLLQAVAARLKACLRESDIIARLGGDEFAVLLTGVDNEADFATIARKLIDEVSRPIENLDGHDIQISPSIGIAVYPRDGRDVETLCRHADAAMYQSKRGGRGRCSYFDAALAVTDDRHFALDQRLPRAIAEGELVLHFQPKVRLSDYRIAGFEALVRWQHPEFGLIYPNEFIPLAEQGGLIVELGDWVADACCRQLAAWQAEGLTPVPIAFNVSARQLLDEALPARIQRCFETHGVAPQLLEVEITESSLVESIEVAGKVLNALEGQGLGIALDDFGSGFSSLGYVRTFPIHTIKIDREFINDIRNSPDDAVIVASIITLAHNLKMKVIAEGVELLDQLVHLKTAGCDEVQGYYLSRPVAADAARQLLIEATLVPA